MKLKSNLKEISILQFGDGFKKRNFVADVNCALASIVLLTIKTKSSLIKKDDVIDFSNQLEKKLIGKITPDGAIWDDIFGELKKEELLETTIHEVKLTETAVREIRQKYGEIEI